MRARRLVLACAALAPLFVGLASSCKGTAGDAEASDAAASPQASAVPALLANASGSPNAAVAVLDSGVPYPTIRGGVALDPDVTLPPYVSGYAISAVLRPSDLTGPPRAPEVSVTGLEAARKKTELRLAIETSTSRLRVVMQGHGWVVPPDTELRARVDRLGHVAVWPGGESYRPLSPGSLRALLSERRFDVGPIAPAEVTPTAETGKRIGIKTRRVEVTTRAGKVVFDLGRLEGLGEGGVLLCRALLDLANGPPTTPVCGDSELPLRATFEWAPHGSLAFEVTGVLRRTDLPAAPFAVPPPGARVGDPRGPKAGMQGLLSHAELAALRTGPVEVPPGPTPAGEGLLVANTTDQVRMLFVDGVPIAWVAPGGKDGLYGLVRGKYVVQWRSFLGDTVDAPATLIVPGAAVIGGLDAGAPR